MLSFCYFPLNKYYPSNDEFRERSCHDTEHCPLFSQQHKHDCSEHTFLVKHDNKVKEPRSLLFYCGAIFLCTFNNPN